MSSKQPKLIPFTYEQYPLDSIRPLGWIEHEIQLSAKGLAGHLFEFYRFVRDSTWLGGQCEYTALNEAAPYWYNYSVPLGYTIDPVSAPELRLCILKQSQQFLDYTLDHQASDGWLGPETTRQTRGLWARCLLLQGMVNHALADASQYEKIVHAIVRFVRLAHSMLSENLTGYLPRDDDVFDPQWFGVARAHELSLSLQWLHENLDGEDDRQITWEVMEMLWSGAQKVDRAWTDFFVDGRFPKVPPRRHGGERAIKLQHGVNVAQGLRYIAQLYRMHPSSSLRQQMGDALKMVMQSHGTASGSFTSDEYIGGLSPQRGVEVCCTVELMYSLAYLYMLTGDAEFADHLEMAAFNAFPAAISEDWWSHQYITQMNQPWACELQLKSDERSVFYDVCRYANVYGLEPEFPCCTVNHPTAFPKLAMNTFMRFGAGALGDEDGVLHAVLTAGRLELPERNITCDTTYPFDPLVLHYTISTSSEFLFAVRIPRWCKTRPTIIFDGTTTADVSRSEYHPHQLRIRVPATKRFCFRIELQAQVEVFHRNDGTVNIFRGPLLYASEIPFGETTRMPRNYEDQISDCAEVATNIDQHQWMARVRDHELLPTGSWGIALDTSKPITVVEDDLEMSSSRDVSVWSSRTISTHLEVVAQEIEWPVEKGTAADPASFDPNTLTKGHAFVAKLVPFASAKLHIAQFPVLREKVAVE